MGAARVRAASVFPLRFWGCDVNPFMAIADHDLWRTHRTDPDLIVSVESDSGLLWVGIHKVGGGTVGRAYAGTWMFVIHDGRRAVDWSVEYSVWTPHTHLDVVAGILADRAERTEEILQLLEPM